MDLRTLRSLLKYIVTLLVLLALAHQASAQAPTSPGVTIGGGRTIPKARPDNGPQPKTIHGTVEDSGGRPVEGAHVLVRDSKSNVTRTLTTNIDGVFSGTGFPSGADYDVTAEFRGETSEKKTVTAFLDRIDNVINFQMKVSVATGGTTRPIQTPSGTPRGPQIETFDLVRLQASMDIPSGVPAPIPAVMLLHGFGEDRTVWNEFKKALLAKGWAVMTVDLRGHGESKTKNNLTIEAEKDWRNSPHEFPLDIDAAMTWLKTQTRIDSTKIAIIGVDVGANLALIASGRFPQVRTVVALNPTLREGQEMAGGAQDFNPRSALIFASTDAEATAEKEAVRAPVQVKPLGPAAGTAALFQRTEITDSVFQWLKDKF